MPHVAFTPHLRRFFPGLRDHDVEASTVAELVRALEQEHPGMASYIVTENGALRENVNIFIDSQAIKDRAALSDPIPPGATVHLLQALSGG